MASSSLNDAILAQVQARLAAANEEIGDRYPGDRPDRQPIHTVYGGAHLFKSTTAPKLGELALRALSTYGNDPLEFADNIGLGVDATTAQTVHTRVTEKLTREPVEDFRIDFEDGYGNRPDDEEDGHAAGAAAQVAKGLADGTLPPFIGIRIKPFSDELCRRSIRTLDIFVTSLLEASGGALPDNFVVTLPKITSPDQVEVLAELLDHLEDSLDLEDGCLELELMVETTQSILSIDGESNLPVLLDAAEGRCVAAHFGTYDYTAACGITAAHQHMSHPACDFARHMMQVAYAGTGIWLSDGATNIMPVAPHSGASLSAEQVSDNRKSVHDAWKLHVEHIRHSLVRGYYQGWDLHPAQLPTRYATVYAFFLEGLAAASERLSNFIDKAAQATLAGDVFDDAATGQGLLNFFLRGVNCGAITEQEAVDTGLTLDELRSRSFAKIIETRSR